MIWNRYFALVYTLEIQILVYVMGESRSDCSKLRQDESRCVARFNLTNHLVSGIPNLYSQQDLQEFCEQAPAVLPCLSDIFEHCQDPFYDIQSYNATFKIVCQHRALYLQSTDVCYADILFVLTHCLEDYRRDVKTLDSLSNKSRCEVILRLRDCVHISESESCKAAYSNYMTSLYTGRFSPAMCDVYTDSTTYSHKMDHQEELYRTSASRALHAFTADTNERNGIHVMACFVVTYMLSRLILDFSLNQI